MPRQSQPAAFILVLCAYLIIGAAYAVRTPAWQAPDEPAHYNYAAQVAANGCCPLIEPGDWDSAYLDTLKSARFAPDLLGRIDTIQYEDHQPPLYYGLAALVFRLTDGSLVALRLLSVVIGAGIVWCAYRIALLVLPQRPSVALGAALLVAFVPQQLAVLASVNNDALAGLIIGVVLLLLVRRLRGLRAPAWSLGVLVGVGLLVKMNTVFLVGLVPLFLLIECWAGTERRVEWLMSRWIAFALPALLMGSVWWVRNVTVYGFPDLFGLRQHDAVVVGQPRTAELIAQVGVGEYLRRGVETTFNSFWGQFGWMALPLPAWAYWAILAFLMLVIIGGVAALVLTRTERKGLRTEVKPTAVKRAAQGKEGSPFPSVLSPQSSRLAWLLLALTVVLAFLQYVYYNTEFVQFQGRYLYPALIPLAIFAAAGLDGWRRLAERAIGERPPLAWLAPLISALFIPLNLFLLWRVIPQLAP